MKISQFIHQALFDEENGYYKTKNPLGKAGDFITAPEISQIFGEMLALYLMTMSAKFNGAFDVVEMGAGRGTLLKDFLYTINKFAHKGNPSAVHFLNNAQWHIIEINPQLQEQQRLNLQQYPVNWHNNFVDFLQISARPMIFISNELFDCYPIDQYVKTVNGWHERLIGFDDPQTFKSPKFYLGPQNIELDNFVAQQIGTNLSSEAPIGAVFEYSQSAREFMDTLCTSLENRGGIALNIDYGYTQYEFTNTLQALKNHRKVDIFEEIYNTDITALVDFVALDKIARNHHLKTSLITQREFLISLGAIERANILIQNNPSKRELIEQDLHRLIDDAQMGSLFKVHIIWRD